MSNKSQTKCEICQKKFHLSELYPLSLIRSNVLSNTMKHYPYLNKEGFICIPDLRTISASHYEEILKQEKGALTELEDEVIESLKMHEILSENKNVEFESSLTFGDRLADKIAIFGGSWTFISIFGIVLFSWMGVNSFQLFSNPFDPYPFIFLNLILSCLAAIQAPIIMMSQNRQTSKDRLTQEGDYQTNLKAELQIRQLNARLELFMKHHWQKMHEISRNQEAILNEIESKQSE